MEIEEIDMKGYIRDKLDVKYLILFVLSFLKEDVDFDDVLESVLVDGAVTYFDVSDAFFEMVDSGHVEDENGKYRISQKGLEVLQGYELRLPASVRRDAQRAVLRSTARRRRNANMHCSTTEVSENDLRTTLKMNDDSGELISITVSVVNRTQGSMLENNFRENAEKIYNAVLTALLNDYSVSPPEEPGEEK